MKRFILSAGFALSLVAGASSPAWAADPAANPATTPASKTGSDPAAAQALFYEARTLMKDNRLVLACSKLEESLRLDYGIGTEFNLADCNEKLGKLASAWSGFLSVAAASKAQNQPQREKVAKDRAKAIEPRLPKLSIEVVAATTPGLEVKRDGVVIGSASWASPVPVDPGPHRVMATAPGRQTWESTINAVEGKVAKISVPQLAADQTAVATTTAAPLESQQQQQQQQQGVQPVQLQQAQPVDRFPEPVVERGSTQRGIGWVIAAAGLAGVGVGAGFGIDSLSKRNRADSHCQGDVCDDTGLSLRHKAMTSGNVATITSIAGGGALLGGIILVLTAPHSGRRDAPTVGSIQAVPSIAMNGGGLTLQGVLP